MRLCSVSHFAAILFIVNTFGGVRVAYAQESNPPTSTGPTPLDSTAKEPYIFELLEKKVRFEADGKGQKDVKLRVRIQSESAVRQFGLIVYSFASGFESLEVDYVRVRKPDGTVVETPASEVQELDTAVSRAAPMYTDEREKHIAVKSLALGDVLEAHVRWVIHEPMAPGHFWYDQNFVHNEICLRETLTIDVPQDTVVKLRSPRLEPEIRVQGSRRIYYFQRSNLQKQPESKIPEWERDAYGAAPPELQLSSFSSWVEVGKWFGGLDQQKVEVTPEIQAKADELTKGKTVDEEKILSLYDFVSTRFRYIGIDLGRARFTPHTASEVMRNRYGDCKDKQVLLAALLQAVGIRSYPALVSSKFAVDPSFPTASLFNHVITAIPRDNSMQFLDATPEVAPFGFLTLNIRDRAALVIPPEAPATLITTPADPPFRSYEDFRVESSISADGTLVGKIRIEDRGDSELLLRALYHATPQNKWEKLTQGIANGIGFVGSVSDVVVSPPEDTGRPLTIEFAYRRSDYPYWKERKVTLPLPPFFLRSLNEEQKQARNALPLGASQDLLYEATMKFPDAYVPVIPGKPIERKSDFAEFSAAYEIQNGTVSGKFHLKVLSRNVPGSERIAYSTFVDEIRQAMSRYIFVTQRSEAKSAAVNSSTKDSASLPPKVVTIVPGVGANPPPGNATSEDQPKLHVAQALFDSAMRAEKKGDYASATQILEQVVSKDPKHKLAWNSLGYSYNNLGLYPKAEAALRKAIELNPADKFAYNNLGNALVGQKKYEEAIPQFLKQIQINPEDKWAHANLGRAYLSTKEYEKAASELERASRLTPDDPAVHFNLGRAYLNSRNQDKGLQELKKSVDLEPMPSRWNVVAYELAVDKVALDEAERYAKLAIEITNGRLRDISLETLSNTDARLPASLGAYWDTLGWVKFQQGDLSVAERYTVSAWQLRSIGEIGDHLGQIYEKLGRKQDAITMYSLALATVFPMPETESRLVALAGTSVDLKQLAQEARTKLIKSRTIAVKNVRDLDGEAEFWMLFDQGTEISATKFISGDETLSSFADDLKGVAVEFTFPDAAEIKLPRRAKVNCSHLSGTCSVSLASSETVRSAN